MKKLSAILGLVLIFNPLAYSMTIDEIFAMNKKSESTEEGKMYKRTIIKELTSSSFMRVCIPPNGPKVNPFFMFFKIEKDGSVSLFEADPPSDATRCMKENVLKTKFTPPKEPYMFGLHMKFR